MSLRIISEFDMSSTSALPESMFVSALTGQQNVERTQDTRLPFMLRTLGKPALPSCAAYLPDLAPAVLDIAANWLGAVFDSR